MKKVEPKKLDCGCRPTDPWPPPAVEEAPRPSAPSEPPDQELSTPPYALRGPQIEPEAAFWTICRLPCLVRIEDLAKRGWPGHRVGSLPDATQEPACVAGHEHIDVGGGEVAAGPAGIGERESQKYA